MMSTHAQQKFEVLTLRFVELVKTVFAGRIEQILTDNGSNGISSETLWHSPPHGEKPCQPNGRGRNGWCFTTPGACTGHRGCGLRYPVCQTFLPHMSGWHRSIDLL